MEQEQIVQIHIRPSVLQVGLAVGASAALIAAGFAMGRVTAESESADQLAGALLQPAPSTNTADPLVFDSENGSESALGTPSGQAEDSRRTDEPETPETDASDGSTAEELRIELASVPVHQISFVTGSEQLTPSSFLAVSDLADALKDHPLIPVELAVKTTTEPTAGQNHGLSTQQAAVLASSLFSQGVDPGRFVAIGVGFGGPGGGHGGGHSGQPLDEASVDNAEHAESGAVSIEVGPRAAAALAVSQIDTHVIDFKVHTGVMMPGSEQAIEDLAAAMKLDPSVIVEIAAHTYSEGSSVLNHDLSHVQGEEVVAVLTKELGIDRARLNFVGHGDPAHFAEAGRNSFITFTVIR